MDGRVHQINVSRGGVPKIAVPLAPVTRDGLTGDVQRNRKYHGGPDRAVCLFSLEVIQRLRSEGHPIEPGAAGENLTVAGLDWSLVVPGAHLAIGTGESRVELEVLSYTVPCSTIRHSFKNLDSTRIKQELHPGESRVYARVLREGVVRAGDAVALLGGRTSP